MQVTFKKNNLRFKFYFILNLLANLLIFRKMMPINHLLNILY